MLQLQLINELLAEMHAGNPEHRPEPKKIGFK
jgi:hypothetical protein